VARPVMQPSLMAIKATDAEPCSSSAALVMLVGPPASGKSYLGRLVAERLGAELIQTDTVRKAMFRQPSYSGRESAAVYAECQRRIGRSLGAGRTVVFDATNLAERRRQVVYRIADEAGARLVVVLTYAPPAIVRQRLDGRLAGVDPLDQSDADWQIYRRLGRADPIGRPHIVANTTVGLDQIVEVIAARAS